MSQTRRDRLGASRPWTVFPVWIVAVAVLALGPRPAPAALAALPGPPAGQLDVDSFLENVVRRFSVRGFLFVFHIDSGATPLDVYFARGVEAARFVVSHSEGGAGSRRPVGYQVIHVVLLRRSSWFLEFVGGPGSVRPPDRALFVLSAEALAAEDARGPGAFWRAGPRLRRLASTALAARDGPLGLVTYDVCYFCGPQSGTLRRTGAWSAALPRRAFATLDLFPDNWADLRGHPLRVLFVPFPPIIWCQGRSEVRDGERVCVDGASGPEGMLLQEASRRLNFSARLVDFSWSAEEGGGSPRGAAADDVSLWDAMVAALASAPAPGDLAVGDISITVARTQQVYFTSVFNREPHTFAFLHAEGAAPGVAGPFSAPLWLCLAATWVATALLLSALHVSCRLLPESLWVTGAMLLGQGAPTTPPALRSSRPARLLLLCWCWLCFVLISLYESKLVSSLVNPAAPQDPSTLEDLLVHRYEMVTPRSSLFAVRGLLNSTDAVYRAAGRRMIVLPTFEDCVGRLMRVSRQGPDRVALIAEHSFLRWGLPRMIPEGEPPGLAASLLRLGTAEILAYGQAWALRRDAMALEPALSRALASATASGLPRFWLDRSLKSGKEVVGKGRYGAPHAVRGLPLQLFAASLCAWAGGLALATAVLLAEVAWPRGAHHSSVPRATWRRPCLGGRR